MVTQWWFCIPVGCVLGFLSGLGIGGGSLLMLWLTAIVGTSREEARILNLMFFIPSALIATLLRWKQTKPDRTLTMIAAAGGLAGALGGNYLSSHLDPWLLEKGLGMLFLLCGIRELCYRERKLR